MKYISWLWRNSCGIRWNTVVRIVMGIGQVVLGLLMVWLSKRFIDETIRTGTADDVLRMVEMLVLTVVGGVVLRQVGYWLKTSANELKVYSNGIFGCKTVPDRGRRRSPLPPHISDILIGCLQYEGGLHKGVFASDCHQG